MLNGLSLFTGIGGIDLALSEWVRPVAYCEIERYAAAVLFSRMSDGLIPTAPIFPDVTKLTGKILPSIDIIYGGFPCQDVSLAGARKGLDGERTGLFREAIRLVRECKPKFVFLENVPGIRRYVPTVRSELEALGYDCRDGFLSAAETGSYHVRNRWWLLAHSKDVGRIGWPGGKSRKEPLEVSGCCEEPLQNEWAVSSPPVGVAYGVPARLDRLKGLGNSVCPLQAKEAFKRLMGI